jgi:hypothetical protein
MSLLLKYSTIKFPLIAVILIALFSFKPFGNKNDNKSSLIIYFKGKKYDIPYLETKEKVKSIYGQLWSSVALVASENKNISFVGLSATSKALNIDIGAVKLGDPQGFYQGENNQSSYFGVYLPSRKHVQVTYFENQKYNAKAQHGTFYDLSPNGKRWDILMESSKIEITLASPEKFEGTFDLDLRFANSREKATGTFVIYR